MNFPPAKRLRGLNQDVVTAVALDDPFGDDEEFTQDDLDEIDVLASQAFTSAVPAPASKPVSKPKNQALGSTLPSSLGENKSATNQSKENKSEIYRGNAGKHSREHFGNIQQQFGSDREDSYRLLEAQQAELKRKLKEVEEEILLKSGEIRVLRDSLKSAQQEKEAQRQNQVLLETQRQKEQSDREKELNRKYTGRLFSRFVVLFCPLGGVLLGVLLQQPLLPSSLSLSHLLSMSVAEFSSLPPCQTVSPVLGRLDEGGVTDYSVEETGLTALKLLYLLLAQSDEVVCLCLSQDTRVQTVSECVSVLTAMADHPTLAKQLCSQHVVPFDQDQTRQPSNTCRFDFAGPAGISIYACGKNLQVDIVLLVTYTVVRLLSRVTQRTESWPNNNQSPCQCYTEVN
ncbi:hypothetical protein GOODEAATRI_018349 [Goodea atripinnis]|uniref:ATR-interacting protein n=1 Tax=Goodea atripinnis TaxID=208336 RepID=A0ABV0P5X8_9TELE